MATYVRNRLFSFVLAHITGPFVEPAALDAIAFPVYRQLAVLACHQLVIFDNGKVADSTG